MQDVNSYYDISCRLRYYGRLPKSIRIETSHVLGEFGQEVADVRRWKNPPHEYLANLPIGQEGFVEPASVEAFVRKYGPLNARLDSWAPSSSSRFEESCIDFGSFQEILCGAWRRDAEALSDVHAQVVDALDARTSINAGNFELISENLWSFICVLLLRDLAEEKAKVCESPD